MLDKMMLRKMTGARTNKVRVWTGMLAAVVLMAGAGRAIAQTSKIGPAAPVTYDNRYEIYGGANFMNFQAGQNLPKRMNMGGGEVLGTYWLTQYRGPKNHYAALNYHAYAGPAFGNFTHSTGSVPATALPLLGLYTNRTAPIIALGGSVDFNRSKNLAVRLSPDLILERFGTETREFFAISGGIVYRFGNR
jgi:hypothetical protein